RAAWSPRHVHVQRRVFFAEAGQAARDLLLVAARLGCDGHAIGFSWQVKRWQWFAVLQAKRVAGERVRELGRGRDIAGVNLGCGHVLLAAREEDLREALLASPAQVGEVGISLQRAGEHLEIADT